MCFLRLGDRINKRLGAMNKPTDVVHSGWMTKSPPEQKLQAPLKLFRAKWKQRFFVLHKPAGSLPDQYELSYYNSEACTKKKGSVDLDQCEQIIESLDSDQYPYLLAIKTVCKSKVRTYYLATSSEDEMSKWVQCLCRVCGLKQEETRESLATDIPDSRLSTHGMAVGSSTSTINAASTGTLNRPTPAAAAAPTITSQPIQTASSRGSTTGASSTSSNNSIPAPSTSPQSYVLLNECTSGTPARRPGRYDRTDSVDSVPEYQAPPPPQKKGHQYHNNNNTRDLSSQHDSVFDEYDHPPQKLPDRQGVYDRPPPSSFHDVYDRPKPGSGGDVRSSQASMGDDNVYKMPPNRGDGSPLNIMRSSTSSDKVDLSAAVPLPRRSPHSARSSMSDCPDSVNSMGRPMTDVYDVPPPWPASMSISSQEGGQTSPLPTPPLRPPKPHNLMTQSPYQNLPPSKMPEGGLGTILPAPPKSCNPVLSYDVPRSSALHQPPRESGLNIAPPPPSATSAGTGHAYLNTEQGPSSSPSVPPLPDRYIRSEGGDSSDIMYADMDSVPPAPSLSKTVTASSDPSYTDMTHGNQDLYQVPPVAPRPPMRTNIAPLARVHTAPPNTGADGSDVCPIWSTQRTKSFKRNNIVSRSPQPVRRPPVESRRPPLPTRPTDVASSSDDDESIDGNNTHHDLSVVRMSTVPAAPDLDNEPELKYLDLALDPPPDPTRPQASGSHATPTEYREIDFVKTRALQDTKLTARTLPGGK